MKEYVRRVEEAARHLKEHADEWPETAIVLGSGLFHCTGAIEDSVVIDTADIPGFPERADQSRGIRIHTGQLGGRPVAVLDSRYHLYDGLSPREVTFAQRMLGAAGTRTCILTCAAGAIRKDISASDLVLVSDQINLTGSNPLEGPNHDAWGPRFPDMSRAFDPGLASRARDAADDSGIELREGVYAGLAGPSLETEAEYRMIERLGADIVGMSLVHEVIVARHMGIDVLGLAVISDVCHPDALEPIDYREASAAVKSAAPRLTALLIRILEGS